MKTRRCMLALVVSTLFSFTAEAFAQFDYYMLFSDNRVFHENIPQSPQYFMLAVSSGPWDSGGVVLSVSQGTPPFPSPISLSYYGRSIGIDNAWTKTIGTPGANWETNQYQFRYQNQNYYWDIPAGSIAQMAAPPNVSVVPTGGDYFHPTISWDAVANASGYSVSILGIDCGQLPDHKDVKWESGRLEQTSIVYNGDALTYGFPCIIRVAAIKDHPWGNSGHPNYNAYYTNKTIGRGCYYFWYLPLDQFPSQNLTQSNGWYLYNQYPTTSTVSVTESFGNEAGIQFSVTPNAEPYAFGSWRKDLSGGAIGVMAMFTVTAASGTDSFIGIRKNVAITPDGNLILAELRITHNETSPGNPNGFYFLIRERDQQGNTVRTINSGALEGWEPWQIGHGLFLALALQGEKVIFFANKWCTPVVVPLRGLSGVQPVDSKAEICGYADYDQTNNSTISATVNMVKIPSQYEPMIFKGLFSAQGDINADGKVGLEEAINALQVISGRR